MVGREDVEKLLSELRRRREEAEAEAGHAAERLTRLAAGFTPPAQLDPQEVRASAETFADAVVSLRALNEFTRRVRDLLT